MLTTMAQVCAQTSFMKDWLTFKTNARNFKSIQQKILSDNLKSHPYLKNHKAFLDTPIRSYGEQVEELNKSSFTAKRYQPTSGSGDREKLIPYTNKFIQELNLALNPWLFDLMLKQPSIVTGKHYWSLSWLPTHYREKKWQLDDFELLPSWKKELTRILMAVPNEVSMARTLEASQFATLAYLIATKNLTFISVWSPTFLLRLLELANIRHDDIAETLQTGKWASFGDELKHIKPPQSTHQARMFERDDLKQLWPELKLISSWDSSTSRAWAMKIKELFPGADFQGKGLWATEGVVTIPFEGQYVLSYLSHYYEFLDVKSGSIMNSWDLKEGMEVQPLLTCGNGFTRYNLKDRMVVTGFYQTLPALEFLERDLTYDMVGEKLDAHCFLEIHDEMRDIFPELNWVIAFAVNSKDQKPYYHFVFEGKEPKILVLAKLNQLLKQRFHYQLALELGQLAPCKVTVSEGSFARYEEFQIKKGMVQGNIKVELATFIKTDSHEKIYHEHFSH